MNDLEPDCRHVDPNLVSCYNSDISRSILHSRCLSQSSFVSQPFLASVMARQLISDLVQSNWIRWRPGALDIDILIDNEGQVWMHSVRAAGAKVSTYSLETELAHALPLAQIRLVGEGSRSGTSERLAFSPLSHRLVYVSHHEWVQDGLINRLEVVMKDEQTRVQVSAQFSVFSGIPILRSTTLVTNIGNKDLFLEAVASLSLGYLNRGSDQWWRDYEVVIANNTNFREAQWKTFELGDLGMDYVGSSDFNLPGTRASIVKSSLGTFSTCGSLPMGALSRKDGRQCYMWQIEHSGSWRWELGNILSGLYVIAGGPIDQDHQWTKRLSPRQAFSSVTTALAVVNGPIEYAFTPFTEYRRLIRREHADNQLLPIIFNDYMNCLDGDPTEEKVLALVEPAKQCGAEYFCIDAGWYSDDPSWWDTVGAWEPSTKRFPRGLEYVLDKIRSAGMIPGLWMEPEVIGTKSPIAQNLPEDAFFQRKGHRVVEQSRYQLDFRHKAVTSRLDQIVNGLVTDLGVGYFKFDYNIDVTQGTDAHASSPGDGMLEHRRAYIAWINSIYDRFPDLIIESCASGAQRLDYHTLSLHSLQSTSDQTDPVLYSAISASVLTALTPEQSASWAYPQPHYSDDLNVLCMVNSLMGRLYLSGRLDLLSHAQLQLVIEGSRVYKTMRHDIKDSTPFWPLGLPSWHQDWLVLGLQSRNARYLAVWRRGGSESCSIPIPEFREAASSITVLYPRHFTTGLDWDEQTSKLSINIPNAPSARLLLVA